MRGKDDCGSTLAQSGDLFPHPFAQFHVDTGGRLVEEEQLRLVGESLGDQHSPLHPARKLADLAVLLFP